MVRLPDTTVAHRGPPCWCQPNTPPGVMVYRITLILDTSAWTIPTSVLNFDGTSSGSVPEASSSPVTPDPGVARTGIAVLNSTIAASATTISSFGFHDNFVDISTSIE